MTFGEESRDLDENIAYLIRQCIDRYVQCFGYSCGLGFTRRLAQDCQFRCGHVIHLPSHQLSPDETCQFRFESTLLIHGSDEYMYDLIFAERK